MSAEFDADALRAKFAALLDGTLPEAEHAELERLLARSEEARRLWYLHCDVDLALADWSAARRETGTQSSSLNRQTHFQPATPRRRQTHGWLAAAAAVLVLGIIAWLWWPARERAGHGVALLARSTDAAWSQSARPMVNGTVLPPGDLSLRSGAALIEFFNGARVVLEGPCEFKLVSAGEAWLGSGKLTAHVPPQARGFAVRTATMNVIDHGTDFALAINRDATGEMHVFGGKVEVASLGKTSTLTTGEALHVAKTLTPMPAKPADFLDEKTFAQRAAVLADKRLAEWRTASNTLNHDAATRVHFTFEPTQSPHQIANTTASAAPESDGSIVGAESAVGRWPQKHALTLRSEADRVRFTVAESMHALTLLAWVRISDLPHQHNSLLCSDSPSAGALHWLITKRGELRLEIGRDLGRSRADWEAVNSRIALTSERYGQWLMLATTFDGKTIRHYLNGEPIGTGASFTPPALTIGTAELGNWHGEVQRHLPATMDEFALLDRAMSDAEIARLFAAGKP